MADTFADLPDALVRDLLAKAMPVAEGVSGNLKALRESRARLGSEAKEHDLIRRKADLIDLEQSLKIARLIRANPWRQIGHLVIILLSV